MSEKIIDRLEKSIRREDEIDGALKQMAALVREKIDNEKVIANAELRRCLRLLSEVGSERDEAVRQLARYIRIINLIKEDLKG
jgi:hypothetical protein